MNTADTETAATRNLAHRTWRAEGIQSDCTACAAGPLVAWQRVDVRLPLPPDVFNLLLVCRREFDQRTDLPGVRFDLIVPRNYAGGQRFHNVGGIARCAPPAPPTSGGNTRYTGGVLFDSEVRNVGKYRLA